MLAVMEPLCSRSREALGSSDDHNLTLSSLLLCQERFELVPF